MVTQCTDFLISPSDEKDDLTQWLLNFSRHQHHLESLLTTQIAASPRVFNCLGVGGREVRLCPESDEKGAIPKPWKEVEMDRFAQEEQGELRDHCLWALHFRERTKGKM